MASLDELRKSIYTYLGTNTPTQEEYDKGADYILDNMDLYKASQDLIKEARKTTAENAIMLMLPNSREQERSKVYKSLKEQHFNKYQRAEQ